MVYPMPQMYYPQAAQQAQGGMVWVQGEASAKSYLLAPNSTVVLWDSERQTIYIKSADAAGMPAMKILDYTIREAVPQTMPAETKAPEYATKADLEGLSAQIKELKAKIEKEAEDHE